MTMSRENYTAAPPQRETRRYLATSPEDLLAIMDDWTFWYGNRSAIINAALIEFFLARGCLSVTEATRMKQQDDKQTKPNRRYGARKPRTNGAVDAPEPKMFEGRFYKVPTE